MKSLADYTSRELMVPDLQNKAPAGVINELCTLLHRKGLIGDLAAFCGAVVNRELLNSTAIAPGWALPHARLKELTQLSFALARSLQPLVWFGGGTVRPQLVFLFAIPEAEAKAYLDLIAALSRLSREAALCEQLMRAPDSQTMFAVLEQVPWLTKGSVTTGTCKVR